MNRYWIWVLGLGIGLAAVADAQQVYRWKDDAGRTHFSNVGPTGGEVTESSGGARRPAEPEPEPAAATAPASGSEENAWSGLSEDSFSTTISRKRSTMQRKLRDIDDQIRKLESEKASLRRERRNALQRYGAQLQGVANAPDVASEREKELDEKKEALQAEASGVREEYAEMRTEAEKRHGSVPGWWRPLD